jgi:hypothetical protein
MIYRGFDVLELNYNRIGRIEERVRRKFVLLDSKTGVRQSDEQSAAPTPTRPFSWLALGRGEIAAMREFLESRKGRAVPFWLPSFQWDLSLASDVAVFSPTAQISWARYTSQMFGTTGARRHLAFWDLGIPSFECYEVIAASDSGGDLTETLTLSPVAARDYKADRTVMSFLKLCRFEQDAVEIRYPSGNVAEATIEIRELPMEAPVS